MTRLKIINLFAQNDGCSYVRHEIPFEELRKKNHFVQMKWPIHRNDFNVAILSRMVHEQFIETMYKMKAVGMKIVYDTDDLLFNLEPENPFWSDSKSAMAVKLTKRCMAFCDMVTTSTEALAEEFRKHYTLAPVKVLPNCVRPADWKERPREKRSSIRIGYAGACSHHKELNFLIPIIRDLQKKYDVEFHIMGIFNSPADLENNTKIKHKFLQGRPKWLDLMRESHKLLKTIKYVHHGYVPIHEYPHRLASLDLDIGLCPLFDTRFNRCKSAIKYYEYALCGTTPLAADTEPYKHCDQILPMNAGMWREEIEELIQDRNLREAIARQEKEWVIKNHDISRNVDLWDAAYQELLEPKPTILDAQGNAIKPGNQPGRIIQC